MSDLPEKQGERFIVLEIAGGTGAFLVDLAQSFGSEAAATAAAKRMAIPGGEKLIVLGFRFCATIVPSNIIPDRGRRRSNAFLREQRPTALPDRILHPTEGELLEDALSDTERFHRGLPPPKRLPK
jgi:hypothetical protein